MQLWIQIARILGTDTIQIPSNFLTEGVTGDFDLIVSDLQKAADLGLEQDPAIRFAYENMCWGTFVETWEQAWEIVTAVDRPNFGICLDTFHIAGREWADPSVANGKVEGADALLEQSLANMVRLIDVDKIFYVQLEDGERLDSPLKPGHPFWVEGQPARMSWSRNARIFAFEEGGYLPVIKVLKAIVDPAPQGLGYQGWISLELFSRTLTEEGPRVPLEHAQRGLKSWNRLVQHMGCNTEG